MGAAEFFQRSGDVRTTRPMGFIGTFVRALGFFLSISGCAEDPQARQVGTSAITATPDNSTAYTVTVDGEVCTYTTDTTATQAELGAGLEAAVNANPIARSKVVASYTGGVLTFTAVWPGITVTIVMAGGVGGGANGAYTPVTAAASADTVAFGRLCCTNGYVTDEGNLKVFVPQETHYSAQVMSFTIATAAGAFFTPHIRINGQEIVGDPVPHNTSADQTCTDLATEIDALMPTGYGVEAAATGGGSGILTLTADVPGAEFEAWITASGHASADVTKAYTTGPSTSTSVRRSMVGVSVRRLDVENATVDGDDPSYKANESVEVATQGKGIVQRDTTETWAYGDEVWVSLAAATKGRFYDTGAAHRVWLGADKIKIERQEPSTSSDGVGAISVQMGA